jgi:hypothetical protein
MELSSTVPDIYHLYTIHGLVNNMYIPLVFALLPDKTSDTYNRLIQT